jgi:anti-anti-sigma regulatory factor
VTAAHESPATQTRSRPLPPGTGTIVLRICGRIGRADVRGLCEHIGAVLAGSDADHVVCDVVELIDPDIVAIEALARLTLTAQRRGCRVRLRGTSRTLQELLAFAGLFDVIPIGAQSGLEPGGQTE